MNDILKVTYTTLISLSFLSVSPTSFAQDNTKSNTDNETLSALFSCADIGLDYERLACQDAEILKLKDATEAKTLVVFDEKSVKDIKKKSFGFSLPKLGLLDLDSNSEKTDAVLLPVKSINNSGRTLTVTMENGQVWQSVDSNFGYIPRKGIFEARIKSAAFGSFVMRISNERVKSKKIRVRRIE